MARMSERFQEWCRQVLRSAPPNYRAYLEETARLAVRVLGDLQAHEPDIDHTDALQAVAGVIGETVWATWCFLYLGEMFNEK